MTYGDGTNGGPEVSIDIIGHEIAHGICQSTANLQRGYNEPGALNEGLSDIWGAVIKNYVNLSKNIWLHDDEINLVFVHLVILININIRIHITDIIGVL